MGAYCYEIVEVGSFVKKMLIGSMVHDVSPLSALLAGPGITLSDLNAYSIPVGFGWRVVGSKPHYTLVASRRYEFHITILHQRW